MTSRSKRRPVSELQVEQEGVFCALGVNEAWFDSDAMNVASLSRTEKDVRFPLTQSPINFSVLRSDARVSHRWGVSVGPKGDAYIYCRDVKSAEKVSLHASGKQHISISEQTASATGTDNRFMNVWREPSFTKEAVATFSLLFPPWGACGPLDTSPVKKDEAIIVGHRDKLVVVGFYIVDAGVEMRSRQPHFKLGKLSMRQGRVLHVVALKEPQGNLLERVQRYFPQMVSSLRERAVDGGDYVLNLQGYRAANSAYMMTFPVHYGPP